MIPAHGFDISGRPPSTQIFGGAIGCRVTDGEIAGPARPDIVRNGLPARLLERLDDLEHAVAPSRPQVDRKAPRLVERLKRGDMPLGEVYDVNIVPHTCAVRRVVIAAENIQPLAPS